MDKTLDTLITVQRFAIAVALAILVAGLSVHPPSGLYDNADAELTAASKGIAAASEQSRTAYSAIYKKSELKAAAMAWLKERKTEQSTINIEVVVPSELAIPDPTRNPLVTLAAQIEWADRVYRDLDVPFVLCSADRAQVFGALNKVFTVATVPKITQLKVHVYAGKSGPEAQERYLCRIEARFDVEFDSLKGLRSVVLDLPTVAVEVTGVEPWVDLEVADALKENGLGDYESDFGVGIPALRELWADIGHLTPSAARAYLNQKKEAEAEKAKEKIEVLGGSFDAGLTVTLAVLVELFLMIYLLAYVQQVRMNLPGNQATVSASPFFGVSCSRLGRLVVAATLWAIPVGASIFSVVATTLPSQSSQPRMMWLIIALSRGLLVAALGTVCTFLLRQFYKTLARLTETSPAPGS